MTFSGGMQFSQVRQMVPAFGANPPAPPEPAGWQAVIDLIVCELKEDDARQAAQAVVNYHDAVNSGANLPTGGQVSGSGTTSA